jgi:hypothetical protein
MQVKVDSTGEIVNVRATDVGSVLMECDGETLLEMSTSEADSLAAALQAVGANEARRAQVAKAAGMGGSQ